MPSPSPEDLPNPGVEPGCPALQVDSLPSEPPQQTTIGTYSIYTFNIKAINEFISCWLGAVPTQKSDFIDVTPSSVIGGMSTLTQLKGCEA